MSYDDLINLLGNGGVAKPERLLHEIYHALDGAYRYNQGRFDAEEGDDEGFFGFAVFKNGWFRIERAVEAMPGDDCRTSRPKGSLTVHAGTRRIKVYRGGPDENFDIETFDTETGSKTKVGLARRNAGQLTLWEGDGSGLSIGDLGDFFAVHTGNSEAGLVGVWLGAPTVPTTENGFATWAFVVHLPNLCEKFGCLGDRGGISIASPAIVPASPSHDKLEEPTVKVTLKQAPSLSSEAK